MPKLDGTTLSGVSETALFTLWCRGSEAARVDSIIDDPLAVRLISQIDYPYREHFGSPNQAFAVRAAAFDSVVQDFLREHPGGTVVALAEGLQTSYWRLGRPQSPWLSVDLPPVVQLREQLLPKEEHVVAASISALDLAWADHIAPGSPVLITAEGLLCYLDKPLVFKLIQDCAERFPGGRFVFDSVPRWWANKKYKTFGIKEQLFGNRLTKAKYVIPPMPFPTHAAEIAEYPKTIPGVASVRQVPVRAGRGLQGWTMREYYQFPLLPSRLLGTITELRFSQ